MKKIIIVTGDPNSINSEIIYKTWKKLSKNIRKKIYLISNLELMKSQLKRLKLNLKLIQIENINSITKTNKLKIINTNLKFNDPFNVKKNIEKNMLLGLLNWRII